jgi:hypothetical protein
VTLLHAAEELTGNRKSARIQQIRTSVTNLWNDPNRDPEFVRKRVDDLLDELGVLLGIRKADD